MNAILDVIKTFIPFGMAFLFLGAIGRICCTTSTKKKTPPDRDLNDEDKQSTLFDKKQDIFSNKKHILKSKSELRTGKQNSFTSKQELISSRQELLSSKQDFMSNKTGLMSSKKSMIGKASDDHSAGIDLIQAFPINKQKKLSPLQKAFLLKEILDAPKAIKPYQRKYPR